MVDETVAVVGAGCAGVLAARELLRNDRRRVVLIEPNAVPGPGVAYGAAAPYHLLNTPARVMSVDPDDPAHFARWSTARGRELNGGDFAQRRWFGEYLKDTLAELVAGAEQVLVTAAVPEDVPEELAGTRFEVRDGEVSRVG